MVKTIDWAGISCRIPLTLEVISDCGQYGSSNSGHPLKYTNRNAVIYLCINSKRTPLYFSLTFGHFKFFPRNFSVIGLYNVRRILRSKGPVNKYFSSPKENIYWLQYTWPLSLRIDKTRKWYKTTYLLHGVPPLTNILIGTYTCMDTRFRTNETLYQIICRMSVHNYISTSCTHKASRVQFDFLLC